jgi:hypothetical protein
LTATPTPSTVLSSDPRTWHTFKLMQSFFSFLLVYIHCTGASLYQSKFCRFCCTGLSFFLSDSRALGIYATACF